MLRIISSVLIAALFTLPVHAFANETNHVERSQIMLIGEQAKEGNPKHRRYANQQQKRHDSGGGIGLSITIDPSKLLKSGKKKKPASAPKKRRRTKKRKPAKKRTTTVRTNIPLPVGSCTERVVALMSDADYLREKADALDGEAAQKRKFAKRWRDIAGQAQEGADYAKKSGLADSLKFHEKKVAELEQRAKDYEASAGKKEAKAKGLRQKADAEEKRLAEREKKACEKYRDKTQTAMKPDPVKISTKKKTPRSSRPNKPKKICGPDITENVLRVLDKMHNDWRRWDSSKKGEKCRDLINPATALSAWDITELSPGTAPLTEDQYEDAFGGTKGYKKYIKTTKFWFEGAAAACAKPRWPCGNTVTFLGQCIHAQVVNYVQWGTMNRLCNQEGSAAAVHAAYSARAPGDIYDGQKIMTGIGSAYTAATDAGNYYNFQSADPGEKQGRRDQIKKLMTDKLKSLMADAGNADFASRAAAACSMPCPITPKEKNKLSGRNFKYQWGGSARR